MIPHVNKSNNDFEDVDLQYAKEKTKHVKWYHKVLLNRTLKVVLALILFGIIAPILLYQFVFYSGVDLTSPDGFSLGSCLVARSSRLLCGIENITAEECHRQCCYDHNNHICFHRFPSRFSYILDQHWADDVSLKPRVATVPYKSQNSLTNIRLSLDEVSSTHLTMTFYNSDEIITGRKLDNKQYEYFIESPELNVVVNSTQGSIFNTMRGPVIASENIWEIAFKLTNESMYGFGEIPIKAETVKVIYNHRGGLSGIPLIYAKINDSYHGLLIDTVNPTEVTFREENVVVIRSITNFGLKFHLFVGPRPVGVMRDVMKYVGFDKGVEYWMLGAHICSEFSDVTASSIDMNEFIREAADQDMPFESHCVKPIVFDSYCDPEQVVHVNERARLLKSAGKKFVPHVSPYILHEIFDIDSNGTEINDTQAMMAKDHMSNCSYSIEEYSDFMLQDANSTGIYVGFVGSAQVVYPDYEIATSELLEKLWIYPEDVDGVVLENNWPLDESEKMVNETHLYLPYFSENFEIASNHTPAWNATTVNDENYLYKHNEYGNSFAKAFKNMTSTPIGASSQWMNENVYISRQNIATSWTNLHKELVEAALGGISGHWLWSTPVCGDTDNFDSETHTSLCVKWYLAATFMPMIKIYSKDSARDPLSFTGTHRALMINALQKRLMLAPYFYTTLQEGPLLRPMFYQFPASENLKDLVSQFSVGNDLLIVPNLQPSQSMVHVVMPPGEWFELWSGLKLDAGEGEAVTMATTEADFLTLIRGGSIVVMQKDVRLTADLTRLQSGFALTIALECGSPHERKDEVEAKNTTSCLAYGTIYMGPNTTIHLEADSAELRITGAGEFDVFCGPEPTWSRFIYDVNIYGLTDEMNNYDHMRRVSSLIDLCVLESTAEIVFKFVS